MTRQATKESTTYRRRELTTLVREALGAWPVVVVTGLRQSGKTTFLRQDPSVQGRRYHSLDDLATLDAARQEPEALIRGDHPVTIDEAHHSPELLSAVQRAVDRHPVPGRYLLSGSANFAGLREVSESLAGRVSYLNFLPFTRRERMGRLTARPFICQLLDSQIEPSKLFDSMHFGPDVEPLEEDEILNGGHLGPDVEPLVEDEILDGGLTPIVLGEATNRRHWLQGYEQTYLERDARSLTQVADLVSLRHLLRLAALRSGSLLNISNLARDAKLPTTTASRYLSLLETSLVVTRLPPYLRSRTARLIKSPRLFVSDSGLAAHLAGVGDLRVTADEPLRGALFETYVLQNLAGILSAHRPRAELSFWSVQGRYEVDFVVTEEQRSVAIEIKAATHFGKSDLSGLRAFMEKTRDVALGILAYNGSEALPIGKRLYAVPMSWLLA